MEDVEVFDSWEPIRKGRGAKGLAKWSRLAHIADKLEGKKHSDISFTTCYPGKEGQVKILGSVEGNLHFLLGYGNPGFHLADYHWQVIDPNLDEEEARDLHLVRGHPSRPELWRAAEMDEFPEGDLEVGMPHPSAVEAQEQARRESEGIRVAVGGGTYLAVPSEQLVYGEHNGHVYAWDVVRESFMAAMNPTLYEAMEAAKEEETEKSVRKYGPIVPDPVKHLASKAESFAPNVYPLVKSLFPVPGSVVPLDAGGETIYATVGAEDVHFYDQHGAPLAVQIYGMTSKSMSLTVDGNLMPSVLYNFGVNYLGFDRADLEHYAQSHLEIERTPTIVKGDPTIGFDDIGGTLEELEKFEKAVVFIGNTARLVLRAHE